MQWQNNPFNTLSALLVWVLLLAPYVRHQFADSCFLRSLSLRRYDDFSCESVLSIFTDSGQMRGLWGYFSVSSNGSMNGRSDFHTYLSTPRTLWPNWYAGIKLSHCCVSLQRKGWAQDRPWGWAKVAMHMTEMVNRSIFTQYIVWENYKSSFIQGRRISEIVVAVGSVGGTSASGLVMSTCNGHFMSTLTLAPRKPPLQWRGFPGKARVYAGFKGRSEGWNTRS